MFSFETSDVNDALFSTIQHLLHEGVEEQSRNGPVLVAPGPVCVEYVQPRQRVLYSPTRDANPFFHLMESVWMLAGDNDIEFPCFFNATYGQYSDDGETMWDAYGWRWRRFFGYDQLTAIIEELRTNPISRRCVLGMWSAARSSSGCRLEIHNTEECLYDLHDHDDFYVATHGGKAVPCNTHAYFDLRGGKLNLTVCNRSNDLLFGMLGANVVHMSFLLEYMAARIGAPIGVYRQFTNNCHVYLEKFSREKLIQIAHECDTLGRLPDAGPSIEPGFDEDLSTFMAWARAVIRSTDQQEIALNVPSLNAQFMQDVVVPMFLVWTYRKWKDDYSMHICIDGIIAPDWQRACREWVDRRGATKSKEVTSK